MHANETEAVLRSDEGILWIDDPAMADLPHTERVLLVRINRATRRRLYREARLQEQEARCRGLLKAPVLDTETTEAKGTLCEREAVAP